MGGKLVIAALIGFVTLELGGCASDQEVRQTDQSNCIQYGFSKGTTDFAACMQRERLARLQYYVYGPEPFWWN